jgi:uncharacterized protein YbjT (DUF2867 family)
MKIKVIITGATGMVGEGVLLECLDNPNIEQVLIVNRKHYDLQHPKLKELLVADFLDLTAVTDQLTGYDACFYCAGISSVGMNEADYTHITYDITLHFAQTLAKLNPGMIFNFVSGGHTDSTEKGKIMWARVKGRTENALTRLPFKHVYNFRPGFMKPADGQKNIKWFFKAITGLYPVLRILFPNGVSTMRQIALAMINTVLIGYPKNILEIRDINELAKG